MKFRKKPVVIDAVLIKPEWFECRPSYIPKNIELDSVQRCVLIGTLEGQMKGQIGDWLITGVKGEVYPCKPDIFEATYEKL